MRRHGGRKANPAKKRSHHPASIQHPCLPRSVGACRGVSCQPGRSGTCSADYVADHATDGRRRMSRPCVGVGVAVSGGTCPRGAGGITRSCAQRRPRQRSRPHRFSASCPGLARASTNSGGGVHQFVDGRTKSGQDEGGVMSSECAGMRARDPQPSPWRLVRCARRGSAPDRAASLRLARARPGHPRILAVRRVKSWMAGPSPAMTRGAFDVYGASHCGERAQSLRTPA
jgi:hypothetical protein